MTQYTKRVLTVKYPRQKNKYYCANRHVHLLYSKLGYRCKEKNCRCFNCGRSLK